MITCNNTYSMTLDDDIEWTEEYGKDYDYFYANYEGLYSKNKNEFVAVEPKDLP